MAEHVLHEKVRQPAPAGLRRARLIDPLLRDGAPRVAFVVAPPGCGKTTLLAQVAATAAGPVAWYRAERNDGDEPALVRHLAAALCGSGVLDPAASRPVGVDDLVHGLDACCGRRATLVVDDVHEITGTSAERALARLLDLGPRTLRVVVGSRRMPKVNVSRLEVAQELLRLDAEDLRFRSWEVEQLFRDVYGEPLAPESSAALSRRTQGWAAGLQMFHLATAGGTQAARRAALDTLNGRSRLVRGYLADNVLRGLSDGRRSFLVRTSALGVMTGPMCDELLGVTGSHTVLQRLEDDQLFTTSDDDGVTYRYHQVLQDHLETVLHDELGRGPVQDWYRSAATLLEREGYVREALRAFTVAEDWASVTELLVRAGAKVVEDQRPVFELHLPAEIEQADPWLTLAQARHRCRRGAVAEAADLYHHAEAMLTEAGAQAECRRDRMVASAWIPGRGAPAWTTDAPVAAPGHWSTRLRLDLVRLRPRDPGSPSAPRRPGDRLEAGLVHLLAGRAIEAGRDLTTVREQAAPHSLEQVVATVAAALLGVVSGRTVTAELEGAELAADVAGQPWLERVSRTALRSLTCLARGEPDATVWDEAREECRQDGDPWGECLMPLLRAAVHAAAPPGPEIDVVRDAADLHDVAVRLRSMGAPVLATWADALRSLSLTRTGSPAARGLVARMAADARVLGMPGAQAVATFCTAVLEGASAQERSHLAGDLTGRCGVVLGGAPAVDAATGPADVAAVGLEVGLLGGFRLATGGREVSWAGVRPRALTLLRVLALSPGVDVHRERLIDLLWPDADVVAGTRRLQVAVSSIRQALDRAGLPGRELLPRRGDAYRLSVPPDATVDVAEFEQAVSQCFRARSRGDRTEAVERARLALALYRGELLPEDGPSDWVVRERERLRQLAAVTARELAEDRCAVGDVGGAIEAAHRSLELDPVQDLAWELLARAHEEAGDPAAAAQARRARVRATRDLVGR